MAYMFIVSNLDYVHITHLLPLMARWWKKKDDKRSQPYIYHSGRFHHLVFLVFLCEIQKLLVNILILNFFTVYRIIFQVHSIYLCHIFIKISVFNTLPVQYTQLPVILIGWNGTLIRCIYLHVFNSIFVLYIPDIYDKWRQMKT